MGHKRAAFIMAAALILSSSTQSLAASSQSRMERGCFCVAATGSGFRPYQIWMYPTQQFGNCAGLEVPSNFKEGAWERLLTCGELQSCLKISMQCEREKPSGEFPEALANWKDRCALADYECFEQPFTSRSVGETKTTVARPPLEDILKNAEERYKEVRKEAEEACGVVGRGAIKKNDSSECIKAREALSEAQARLDKQKLDSIKLVRSLEKATDALRQQTSKTCSQGPRGQKNCQKAQESVGLAQKAMEETTNDIKRRLYGCINFWQTPLECANITFEGAKLTLSELGKPSSEIKPEAGTTGPIEKKSLKEKILSAKQDALSGHLKDCKKADGGFSCLDAQGQRYPVDYTMYKGWELAQGKAVKPIEGKKPAQKPEGQPAAKKEKKAEGVAGMGEDVRAGFELANRLKDDLRNTAKWPSKKLNPSDVRNFDPELRAKYDEQMKLANALKREPLADPAALAQKLNLKSDPLKELGVPSLTLTGQAKEEGASSDKSRLMTVVDQDGRSADKKIGSCQRSYGFVIVSNSGVSYCQQVPKASKTLARIKDPSSVTGFRMVKQCPAGRPFQNTNWAGPGSGECLAMKSP